MTATVIVFFHAVITIGNESIFLKAEKEKQKSKRKGDFLIFPILLYQKNSENSRLVRFAI